MKARMREMLMQRKHLEGAGMFELKFIDMVSRKAVSKKATSM